MMGDDKKSNHSADFSSSKFGTKQYWDETYKRELLSYQDIGDVGEIWFGEQVQDRMVRWLMRKTDISSRILELGCGNGVLLMALKEEDFKDLTGVDYSQGAIDLANKVAEAQQVEGIIFKQSDLLDIHDVNCLCENGKYDVCVDKGTYDAICLRDASAPTDRDLYVHHVSTLLKPSGRLLITSCNWTKEQLLAQFDKEFIISGELPAPSFTFGGKLGQTVTSLEFTKKT